MLDVQFILDNRDIVEKSIKDRGDESVDIDKLEKLFLFRKELIQKIDLLNSEKKKAADERDNERGKKLKEDGVVLEGELRATSKDLIDILSKIPNVPLPDVPIGKDDSENVVIKEVGEKRSFSFKPLPHWELGKKLDMIDNERGSNVAGSRFTYLKGDLVKLQFALINFVINSVTDENLLKEIAKGADLDVVTKPFIPVIPPSMVKKEILFGMARLEPEEDKFYLENDSLFLSGSAEHALGPMHTSETFEEKDLPIRYIGYSTAFRREAGSYGKDTKGILRQHQFDKLEFESFTIPEKSRVEQDFLVAIQEYFMKQLNIPYRVVYVCTGDMGNPASRQIDIETWMPGQDAFRETHSADLTGEYQSRRLSIRVKRDDGSKEFVHLNDATAFAIGRILIAIIENYQEEDGTIKVPDILRELSGVEYIRK